MKHDESLPVERVVLNGHARVALGTHDAEQVGTGRLPTLRAAATALLAAETVEEVSRALLEHGLPAARAAAGVVVVVDHNERQLELVASSGYDPVDLEGWERFSLDLPLPLTDAIRTRRVVVIPSVEDLHKHYPHTRSFPGSPHALVAIPLLDGHLALGAVGWRFNLAPEQAVDQRDLVTGEVLSRLAAERLGHRRAVSLLETRVAQLQQALDSRIAIEQAKGLLAERHGIDAEDAFLLLRRYARQHGVRLRQVALSVLKGDLRL